MKSKRRDKKLKFFLPLFLIFLFTFIGFLIFSSSNFEVLMPFLPEMSTEGFVRVRPDARVEGEKGILILYSDCYKLEGWTDAWIAESILRGMTNRSYFRPDAHEVMRDLLDTLDVQVLMVKIVDVVNNTFIGRLIIRQGKKIASLDIRPSNAVAIAVRTNTPIYINETILEEYGVNFC